MDAEAGAVVEFMCFKGAWLKGSRGGTLHRSRLVNSYAGLLPDGSVPPMRTEQQSTAYFIEAEIQNIFNRRIF